MCRWIAYAGEPIFIDEFVTLPAKSLLVQSHSSREAKNAVNADGFGLGWYGERKEPGIFRDVRPAWSDENLQSLARQLKPSLFFAHIRASTGTATMRANCHPFAMGRWMFMHNGGIGGWDEIRRRIEAAIPDALFRFRGGTTDSEAIFLLLAANGLDEDPAGAFRRTLGFIQRVMAEAGIEEPLRVTAATTRGEAVHAIRYSTRITPETLYVRTLKSRSGMLLASEPLDDGRQDWEAIPPQSLVTMTAERVSIMPFNPEV